MSKYSILDASRKIGVHRNTIQNWIHTGKLYAEKQKNGYWLIDGKDLKLASEQDIDECYDVLKIKNGNRVRHPNNSFIVGHVKNGEIQRLPIDSETSDFLKKKYSSIEYRPNDLAYIFKFMEIKHGDRFLTIEEKERFLKIMDAMFPQYAAKER